MGITDTLTEKAGPLPLWGWAVAGGGVILLLSAGSRRSAVPVTPATSGNGAIGVTTADIQAQIADALGQEKTVFGQMLAQQQAGFTAQQAALNQQLAQQQTSFASSLAAAAKQFQDQLTAQRADSQSTVDALKAALNSALAALKTPAATIPPASSPGNSVGGSVGGGKPPTLGNPTGGNPSGGLPPGVSIGGPPDPGPIVRNGNPAPTLGGFTAPDWLRGLIPFGQIRAGYNADHTLPVSLDRIQQLADRYILPSGEVLPSWGYTVVGVRGQMISLPIAYTPQGAANAEDTINKIVGRLNSLADGGWGWGANPAWAWSDPRNVYIIIRSVIEDQVHAGKPIDSLGTPWAAKFLAGS
jgi:hypothetical protein